MLLKLVLLSLAVVLNAPSPAQDKQDKQDKKKSAEDSIKTVTKKVPLWQDLPSDPPTEKPKGNWVERWSAGGFWTYDRVLGVKLHGISGVGIALNSAETETAEFLAEIKNKFATETEKQGLWAKRVSLHKDRIVFSGEIQLDAEEWKADAIRKIDWTFLLFTDSGKRIKPLNLSISSSDHRNVGTEQYPSWVWYSSYTVTFPNTDGETDKPILSKDTKEFTVAVGGDPGQMKFRFAFDPKKK